MTKKHLFSRLLKKAVSMALWTKAITCDKAGFKSRFCQEHQAGKNIISVNPVILSNFSSCRSLSAVALAKADAFVARILCACPPRRLAGNPWLINDLRACKMLYNCREFSTSVESSLQIRLFMQNKANFRKVKLNVNSVLTRDYERFDTWWSGKTKPIQSQLKPIKANQSQLKPIKCQNKPKTNPIKTKQTQCLSAISVADQRQKNLLRLKINTRRKSLGYYTPQIEAPNAYYREKAGNRINSISAVDLLHSTEQRAKICIVFHFDRLILT